MRKSGLVTSVGFDCALRVTMVNEHPFGPSLLPQLRDKATGTNKRDVGRFLKRILEPLSAKDGGTGFLLHCLAESDHW